MSPDLLRLLAKELAPLLREELGLDRRGATQGDLVDLAAMPPSKRRCYGAARSGEIAGAVRLQRKWFAPLASYQSWTGSISVRPALPCVEAHADDLADLRARIGLRKVG